MKIKNKLYSFFIRVTLRLHNFCYRVISKLVLLENNGTHPKHRIMDYGSFFVNNVNESDKVIDIGCGKGEVAYLISSRAKAVVAVDLKEKNINHAKNKFRCANLIYIVADAVSYKWDQKFDKVILSNVLEHIDDRINFLQKLHSVASTILLRVPMINRDWLVMYKKEKGVDYRLDPTHFIEYDLNTLFAEMAQSNWKIESYSVQFGEFWGVVKAI